MLSCSLVLSDSAPLSMNLGDPLPSFTLPDQDWNDLNSDQLLGHPCVLFFYPKDDTPGCVRQACSFRDQFAIFQDKGAEVIGISSDTPEVHRKFQEKYRLPYRLLSDKKGDLRKKFGVEASLLGLLPRRSTFIFDESGKLIHKFRSQLQAEKHIEEAIKALTKPV